MMNQSRYTELVECGQGSQTPSGACSYVTNPSWNYMDDYVESKTQSIPLSTDICSVSYKVEKYSEMWYDGNDTINETWYEGYYRSRMFYCDQGLQTAFVAEWNDSRGCNGEPSLFEKISSYDGFVCNNDAGPCDYVQIRVSDAGPSPCTFGYDHGQYEGNAFRKDYCFQMDSDGPYVKMSCDRDNSPNIEYNVYGTIDCSGDPVLTLEVDDNGCINPEDGSMNGDLTFLQLLSCNGDSNIERPDCRYILNAEWYREESCGPDCEYESHDKRDGYTPIGYCDDDINDDKRGSMIFECTPWGTVALFYFENSTNCTGSSWATEIEMYEDFNCDSENNCDVFNALTGLSQPGECALHDMYYEQTLWVDNVCWNDAEGDGQSVYITCSQAPDGYDIRYVQYSALGMYNICFYVHTNILKNIKYSKNIL